MLIQSQKKNKFHEIHIRIEFVNLDSQKFAFGTIQVQLIFENLETQSIQILNSENNLNFEKCSSIFDLLNFDCTLLMEVPCKPS